MDQKTKTAIALTLRAAAAKLEAASDDVQATAVKAAALPEPPADFQLYDMEGADDVTEALQRACLAMAEDIARAAKAMVGHEGNWIADDKAVDYKLINSLIREHITPLFNKYSNFGTHDGEPSDVVAHYIKQVMKTLRLIEDDYTWHKIRDKLAF